MVIRFIKLICIDFCLKLWLIHFNKLSDNRLKPYLFSKGKSLDHNTVWQESRQILSSSPFEVEKWAIWAGDASRDTNCASTWHISSAGAPGTGGPPPWHRKGGAVGSTGMIAGAWRTASGSYRALNAALLLEYLFPVLWNVLALLCGQYCVSLCSLGFASSGREVCTWGSESGALSSSPPVLPSYLPALPPFGVKCVPSSYLPVPCT